MGLMDKFKNLFTDEEIIEDEEIDTVEIKEVKKEEPSKLPTFMREKIEKEEQEKKAMLKLDDEEDNEGSARVSINEVELPRIEEKKSFKFPVEIEENDYIETRSRQNIHSTKNITDEVSETVSIKQEKKTRTVQSEQPKVADLYKDKREEKVVEKSKFKATPIISPIYGILDKNYTNGDIETSPKNNLEDIRHSKSVDFDSVRKKAYGNLTKEIKENLMCENCEYLKEAKECQKRKEQEYSYEILDNDYEVNNDYQNNSNNSSYNDSVSNYEDITLDEATENYYDYGVEYEKQPEVHYEEEVKISNFEEERPKKEIPPVKSSINLLSTLKKSMGDNVESDSKKEENLELTDDLFNLIDSMYDERNEN